MTEVVQLLFKDVVPAADTWEGACWLSLSATASFINARLPALHTEASNALIRRLLHVFGKAQLQRALALVDQARSGSRSGCAYASSCYADLTLRPAARGVLRGRAGHATRAVPGLHHASLARQRFEALTQNTLPCRR